MSRLINAQLAAARQDDAGKDTPTLILNLIAVNSVLAHVADEFFDVFADEEEFVDVVSLGWMKSDFSRWQSKDEPTVSDVHVWEI